MVKGGMDGILKDISLRFYKDIRVVKVICEHPLLFVKKKIQDPNDVRPIWIPYFGKFVMKNIKSLQDKQNNTKKYEKLIAKYGNRNKK